mgnify:CR=1 FL=1
MAQYIKEIKLGTAKGDYIKRLTGSYNVVFDKIIKVDNSNAGIDLVNYGTSIANDTMTAPKAILVENTGGVGCELLFSTAEWTTDDATDSADTLSDATHYLSMLLPAGECVYLPNNRLIGTATAFGGGMGVAVDNQAPSSNCFADITTAASDFDNTTDPVTFVAGDGDFIKVGDLLRCNAEVVEVTAVSGNNVTVKRALFGTTAASHGDGETLRVQFTNMHHDFDDTSYNGGGNGSATVCKTNASGKFRAMNFFGYGRTADAVCDGLVAGSVALKFYNQGFQEFGLAGITSSTKTGLAVSTEYTFSLKISGGSADDVAFTTDSSDVTFGNVIAKIQSAINDKYTTGTNLKNKKARIGIVNGDIRITDSSRLSTGAILMAAPSSGTTPFAVGIIPAVGVLEAAVAAKLPDDTLRDSITNASRKNTAAFLLDNGRGQLVGAGGGGSINYETGEININSYANAEFVVSANTKAAHCGGAEDSATTINGVVTLEARSCNQKADTEIRIISLG